MNSQRDSARGGKTTQPGRVRPQSGWARESLVPLVAVLNAHAIKEEQQAECAQQSWRRGFRRKGAAREADKQHSARSEREPLEVDVADEVAGSDDQEERGHRRGLEKGSQPVHSGAHCRTGTKFRMTSGNAEACRAKRAQPSEKSWICNSLERLSTACLGTPIAHGRAAGSFFGTPPYLIGRQHEGRPGGLSRVLLRAAHTPPPGSVIDREGP